MMITLSDRVNEMEESATLAMSRITRELKSQGKDIVSLTLGEPDFNTPDFIKEAAIQAIQDNYSFYTPVSGYLDLRESICTKLKRDNGLDYTPDQIVVSTGAKQSIANLVMALINPGDEVIIPAPFWVSYAEIVKLAGGIPIILQTDIHSDFKMTADQFRAAITSKSKMMIFSSPCNPSGSVYSKKDLAAWEDIIKSSGIYVISDEIYEHINFAGGHTSLASFAAIKDQVITVNGVSKAWAMTGWRLGYLAAAKEIALACDKIQGQFTSATCSITQRAVIAAMNADPIVLKDMVAAYKSRRDLVLSFLEKIPDLKTNVPDGAFYLFPDVSAYFGRKYGATVIQSSEDLTKYLLNEGLVSLVNGEAFGTNNCIRISYATSEENLIKAMTRITDALSKLS
jgi:aspartate aminotransferase